MSGATKYANAAMAAARDHEVPTHLGNEAGHNDENTDQVAAEVARLAKLDTVAYDRERKRVSEALEIRVGTLDDLVASERGDDHGKHGQGSAITFAEPEPWPSPVDGAELLDDLATFVSRFVILPEDAAAAVALWVVFTFTHDAFWVSPLLAITSPDKGCGKTTLLGTLALLVHRPISASNITPAATFRVIEAYTPTLLIDEADSFLPDNNELRGVLNSGHTRKGASIVRTVGESYEPMEFSTWCPKAIALIGSLPATLADRSVGISMRRSKPGDVVEQHRLDRPADTESLRSRCARWASDHCDALKASDPVVPAGLYNRAADNFRPLLAIAERAGGIWPQTAQQAALALGMRDEAESVGVTLLADIRTMLERDDAGAISTAKLAAELSGMEERLWPEYGRARKPISTRQVAALLKPFGIRPQQKRDGQRNLRHYRREDFADAFERYLAPSKGALSATTLQSAGDKALRTSPPATSVADVADEKPRKASNDTACSAVARESTEDAPASRTPTLCTDERADAHSLDSVGEPGRRSELEDAVAYAPDGFEAASRPGVDDLDPGMSAEAADQLDLLRKQRDDGAV